MMLILSFILVELSLNVALSLCRSVFLGNSPFSTGPPKIHYLSAPRLETSVLTVQSITLHISAAFQNFSEAPWLSLIENESCAPSPTVSVNQQIQRAGYKNKWDREKEIMGRITRWKGKDLFDGEPERGECDVCVEAVTGTESLEITAEHKKEEQQQTPT